MLTQLVIKDFVLIKETNLTFDNGFSVLTGETGAGKSILLEALSLLQGGAVDMSCVRVGSDQASITAFFDISHNVSVQSFLKEQDLTFDVQEDLILKRVLNKNGRSKSYLNDEVVSSVFLKTLSTKLMDRQGQFDRFGQGLEAIDIIDSFLKDEPLLEKVKQAFHTFKGLEKKLKDSQKEYLELVSQKEELEKALDVLEAANVRKGEEEELLNERQAIQNFEKISSNLDDATGFLESSSFWQSFYKCQKNVEKIVELGKLEAKEAFEALERAQVELQEAAAHLQKLSRSFNYNPQTFQEIEERLYFLKSLARTYKVTADDLPEVLKTLQDRLGSLLSYDERIKSLQREVETLKDSFVEHSLNLYKKRQEIAKTLEEKMQTQLKDLLLMEASFRVFFEEVSVEKSSEKGIHLLSFWVSMNKGQEASLLQETASGGELSRFMLAFKSVMSDVLESPTLLFDEIDTGVGGAVAAAMGQKMKQLGLDRQVIAITHAPQVASLADHHFLIHKQNEENTTLSYVKKLSKNERLEEVARMLSGESITEQAKAAALSLLEER